MSQDIATLAIKVDSSGVTNASKDLDKLSGAAGKSEAASKKATASIAAGWISVAAATAAVMKLIQQSVQAFMAQEKAALRMGMAMKNQGDYSRAALKDMQDYASQLQKVTAYEDDATVSLMANLKSYGMTNAEVKKATKVAMDYAAAKQAEGMTVSTAAELLGKAYAGSTMMLGRYGIIIDDTLKKGEKFDAVLKLLNQRFGGSAQAKLLTYAGQWAKLKNQWSDIQEFLGLVFLKTLQALQVAAGLVAVAFMSMGSKILQVLDFLMTPIKGLLMLVGLIADTVGAKGLSTAMDLAVNSISDARKNILATKESTLGWTSANYEVMKSFDGIEKSLDRMGKSGKRTTYNTSEKGGDGATKKDAFDVVDLWIKDEARKWEELEAYEKKYNDDRMAAQAEYHNLMIDLTMSATEQILQIQNDELAHYKKLKDEQLITDEQYINAKKAIENKTTKDIRQVQSQAYHQENSDKQEMFANTAQAFDALGRLYAEDSSQRKALSEASKIATMAEIAMQAEKNIMIAVGAVVNQATGDPYSAFARMAAMAAAVTGVLSIAGLAFGGGGISASSTPSLPKSTVLGAADGTGSESIKNSYELLKDTYDLENTKLTQIKDELQSLNQNMTGLVTSIVKTGGISPLSMGISVNGDLKYGDFLQRVERWGGGFGHLVGSEGGFFGQLEDFLSKPLMQIASWIGGGETSKKISQQGLSFSGSLANGMNPQQYADIVTTINGGSFASDSKIRTTKYAALNDEVSTYITGVFDNLKTTIKYVADGLGVDANNALNHMFDEMKLNLRGKTPEEMTTAVNVFFSNFSDTIATILSKDIPLKDYQRLGEGLLETSVRLVVQMSTVTSWYDAIGVALNKTTPELIDFTDAVINAFDDINAAKDAWSYYWKEFIPADQQLARSIQTTTERLAELGQTMPKTEAAFNQMMTDAMSSGNSELIAGLLKLAPSIHSIIESWSTAAEQAAEKARQAVDAAKGDLQRAFEAAKNTVQENHNKQLEAANKTLAALTENVNKLKSARERMNLVDRATEAITFQRSKQALMKGVYNDDILASVSAIRPEMYSTKAAYMADYGKIYGKLALLEAEAQGKVSYQQRHIDLLTKSYEAQIAAYDKQYNELMHIDTSVLSVADAIKKFQTASAAVGNCSVPAYADGGWVQVGENGPELARFGSSARVYSNKDSKSLLDTKNLEVKIDSLIAAVKTGNVDAAGMRKIIERWENIGPHATRT